MFDNTGLVFPIGSAYSVKLSNTIYCPILPELRVIKKKSPLESSVNRTNIKWMRSATLQKETTFLAFHVFNLDSGAQNQFSQNPWFLNLVDNKQ